MSVIVSMKLNRVEAAAEKVQELNPLTKVGVEARPLKELGENYYGQFDVVCACTQKLNEQVLQARLGPFFFLPPMPATSSFTAQTRVRTGGAVFRQ